MLVKPGMYLASNKKAPKITGNFYKDLELLNNWNKYKFVPNQETWDSLKPLKHNKKLTDFKYLYLDTMSDTLEQLNINDYKEAP